MRITTVVALVCLFFAFQACTKEEPYLPERVAQLVGTWQLVEPDSSYKVTLQLSLDTANPPNDVTPFKANGQAAVNSYDGFLSAAVDGLMIFVRLGSTEIAGSPTVTQFEQAYFDNLRSVVRFEVIDKNRLRLYHGGQKPGVLVYKKIN
ncbi:META domain-containing protein [Spirosoma soli]|uniref:META domain-containing protein n=1 Tax=Spirosoma soli TaxID=1770529 RepID=A0ABW5MCJ2_9BACT